MKWVAFCFCTVELKSGNLDSNLVIYLHANTILYHICTSGQLSKMEPVYGLYIHSFGIHLHEKFPNLPGFEPGIF